MSSKVSLELDSSGYSSVDSTVLVDHLQCLIGGHRLLVVCGLNEYTVCIPRPVNIKRFNFPMASNGSRLFSHRE